MENVLVARCDVADSAPGTYFSGTGEEYERAASLQGGGRKVLDRIWLQISCRATILFAAAVDLLEHRAFCRVLYHPGGSVGMEWHATASLCLQQGPALFPTVGLAEA